MNYSAIYSRLIERSFNRVLTGYVERHHIIPRCLGGEDDQSNIAILTAREHYVAHQLLAKMYPENHGLVFAAVRMTMGSDGRVNNRLYSWLRERNADAASHTMKSWHTENEHPRGMKGKTHSDETRQKISDVLSCKIREIKGVAVHMFNMNGDYIRTFETLSDAAKFVDTSSSNIKYTAEGRFQSCMGYRWSYDINHIFDVQARSHSSNKGKMYITDGVCNKMITPTDDIPVGWYKGKTQKIKSDASSMHEILTCPHCGKQTIKGNAVRWHYDNCKEKHV